MRVGILGPGAIGSSLAVMLAQRGHDVTLIARGERLAHVRAQGGIASSRFGLVPVEVAPALDGFEVEVLFVCLLGPHLDAVRESLGRCEAGAIVTFVNAVRVEHTFRGIDPARLVLGMPGIVASLEPGTARLTFDVVPSFVQPTTLGPLHNGGTAAVRSVADLLRPIVPVALADDMPAWLRTHVAWMLPTMLAAQAHGRGALAEHRDAILDGWCEGFRLCLSLGPITPRSIALLAAAPRGVHRAYLEAAVRVPTAANMTARVSVEPGWLIGELEAIGFDAVIASRLRRSLP